MKRRARDARQKYSLRCPRCTNSGFRLVTYADSHQSADGRPAFCCDQCGHWWTGGHDGGDDMLALQAKKR